VEALAIVSKLRQTRLLLTGMAEPFDPLFAKEIDDLAKKLKVKSQIIKPTKLISYQDLPALYRDVDIVIVPSYFEGLGLTAIEALAAAKPLIATDVPGLREVATTSNALVIPHKNSQALADAIIRLINDQALAKALGANGPKAACPFDIRKYAACVEGVYEEALA
jgi:glycosyltransferase involved in cell wall biosynthesis